MLTALLLARAGFAVSGQRLHLANEVLLPPGQVDGTLDSVVSRRGSLAARRLGQGLRELAQLLGGLFAPLLGLRQRTGLRLPGCVPRRRRGLTGLPRGSRLRALF